MSPSDTSGNADPSNDQAARTPAASNKLRRLGVALFVVVLVAGATGWWWNGRQRTPDKVFTAALGKLLSTKTLTQTATLDAGSITIAYDNTNVKDPKISMSINQGNPSLASHMVGYGTLQNSYLKYTTFGNKAIDNALNGMVKKWVQLRADGKLPDGIDAQAADMIDPRYLLFGDVITGNFSPTDRQKLLDYIAANNIYGYDAKKVTTATVHGKEVFVYSVTENVPKVKELNKRVAKLIGIPVADIQPALDGLGKAGTTKLYVDTKTKELVLYTTSQDGTAVSGGYSEYDTTSLPQEPKMDLTWAQFQQKQAALGKVSGGGSASDSTTTDNLTTTTQQI